MPIRKNRPTSAGRRFQTVLVSSDITARKPYKPLTEPLPRSGGRNNHGEITSWWRGGGHKRTYRIIDFKRDKKDIPAKVSTIEYDPNRSARIALVTYADGEKRYILQPAGLKVGDSIVMGDKVDILPGNTLPLKNIPLGTLVHNVELRPGKGGQIARSAGSAVQVVAKEGRYASVKMPSGELRLVMMDCLATVGQVGNLDHEKVSVGKAGRSPEVVSAIARHGAVYFAAIGGTAALLARSIKKVEMVAYEDLGTEAVRKLWVEGFPAVVAVDSRGNDLFAEGYKSYAAD